MWSNFRDVRSLAEKISHAVAPPADDDGAEEEEYSYGVEEEDETYSDEDDAPEQSPFGFVGLLTRAMDQSDQRQRDGSERRHETTSRIPNDVHDDDHESVDFQVETSPNDPLIHLNNTHDDRPQLHEALASSEEPVPSPPVRRRAHVPRDDSMDDYTPIIPPARVTYPAEPSSSREQEEADLIVPPDLRTYVSAPEEPLRRSLVRESGSVSPQRNHGIVRLTHRDAFMEHLSEAPLSSRSLGSTPSGTEVLLSPLRDILRNEAEEDRPAVMPSRDALLGSFSVAQSEESAIDAVESSQRNHHHSPAIISNDDVVPEITVARSPPRVDSGMVPKPRKMTLRPTTGVPLHSLREDESSSSEPAMEVPLDAHQHAEEPRPEEEMGHWQSRCQVLQLKLDNAERHVIELQQQAASIVEQDTSEHQKLVQHFQEKEARLLQASAEEHNQEMLILRQEMSTQNSLLQNQLLEERKAFQQEREQMESTLSDYRGKLAQVESLTRTEQEKSEKTVEQMQQNHLRALRKVEDKLAHAMALIDERDGDVKRFKETIKKLESKVAEHHEGADEAEEELDELHHENETLHNQVERLQSECAELRNKISKLEGDSDKLVHLRMELRMLKEDHSREKAKIQTVAASAESSTAQLESERDQALAKVHDLQLQLAASTADVDLAKSDVQRISIANANLQAALEAFQNERDAEMEVMEENWRQQEQGLAAAHVVALEALRETNQAEIRQLQRVSDAAIMNSMEEIKKLEEKLEVYRIENVQTRRSLDEAIKRLQATQDDVIDRTLMKNILLDWLTKTERKEKLQILEVMASVLHFTDAEKERVHIDEVGGLRKLVAPPPAKADIEHLEGDNVREKWVNFLIAEADD